MSRIQRIPSGLLAALGIRGTGTNPDELSPVVIPAINVGDFYDVQALETTAETATLVALAPGNAATLVVPEDEIWKVHGLSGRIFAISGAATIAADLTVRPSIAAAAIRVGHVREAVTTTDEVAVASLFGPPKLIYPGSTLALRLASTAAITVSLQACAWIRRLTV